MFRVRFILIFSILILCAVLMITNVISPFGYVGLISVTTLGYWWINRRNVNGTIKKKFQEPTPQPLLMYYDKSIRKSFAIPEAELLKGVGRSIVLSYYGQFETASLELSDLDFSNKPDMYEGGRLTAIITNNFLQRTDLLESLEQAKTALKISTNIQSNLGKKKAISSSEAYVEIGSILTGNGSETIVGNINQRYSSSPFVLQLIMAWALGVYYTSTGNTEKIVEMRSYLEKCAPYCKPLHDFSLTPVSRMPD